MYKPRRAHLHTMGIYPNINLRSFRTGCTSFKVTSFINALFEVAIIMN